MKGTSLKAMRLPLARNRSLAVQYAQEGLEALRSVRDRSFSELPSSGTSRVVWTGSEWGVLAGTEKIGTYTRSFTPEQISAGNIWWPPAGRRRPPVYPDAPDPWSSRQIRPATI